MSGAVTRFTANSSATVSKLLNSQRPFQPYGRNIGSFAVQKNAPGALAVASLRQWRGADQERMQPEQESEVKDDADDHGDDVVPRRSSRRNSDQPRLLAPLQRDAVIGRISEERGEQDDGGKVAIGDEMS